MEAVVVLCDHAVVAEGKLYISGGGWDLLRPAAGPTALAVMIRVDWSETNNPLPLKICLVDEDGNPVTQQGPTGEDVVLQVTATFEVGRPPGLKRGSTVTMPMALPIAPMTLQPDRGYEWRVEVGGSTIGAAPFRTWPN